MSTAATEHLQAEPKIKAIAPWFGGKRNLASAIVEEIGEHRVYWEPFCGSMAVLLSKPSCVMETVNDLHGDLVNLKSSFLTECLTHGKGPKDGAEAAANPHPSRLRDGSRRAAQGRSEVASGERAEEDREAEGEEVTARCAEYQRDAITTKLISASRATKAATYTKATAATFRQPSMAPSMASWA